MEPKLEKWAEPRDTPVPPVVADLTASAANAGASAERPAPFTDAIRRHTNVFAVLLAGIVGMSVLDGLLTTVEVTFGIAREANPVLQAFFAFSPLLALLFKVVLTALVVVAMWRGRASRLITRIAVATFLGYGALIAYHLGSLAGYRLI